MNKITRRELLLSLPALAVVPRLFAQGTKPTIPLGGLNHFTLAVSDVSRSVDFYQGLFGMPIQARHGSTVVLRIGDGPQFLAIEPAGSNPPRIVSRIGITVESFDVDRIIDVLAQHGVTRAEAGDPGLSGGPMKVRVRMRGPQEGGAEAGTPELYLGDPDGMILQLQHTTYCGGAGPLGNMCAPGPEAATPQGLLALKELNHFTISVSDADRSNAFYQEVFGLPVRSRQANTPGLGVGPGAMFLMFTGGIGGRGADATPRQASIHHACMNMGNFDPDAVLDALAGYGISPRGDTPGPVGPMRSYVSLRMPNRGGAPEGTPELYFTDPDGLLMQLQDVSYCGGGGVFGNECLG